jgi:hypothetical protein
MEVVASQEVSSRLVAGLERVCDHPVVAGRLPVELGGNVVDFPGSHFRLMGARRTPASETVIEVSHTDEQSVS